MIIALQGVAEQPLTPPPGVVTVTIDDRYTDKLSNGGSNSRAKYFIDGTQPTEFEVHEAGTILIKNGQSEELF